MKKTLLAVALVGLMASTASADQVTLYGKIDLGLSYLSIAGDHNPKLQDLSDSTFTMDSGNNSGSRWGLLGTETLGNGVTVGFQLENGFSADDGKLGNDSRLFGREARLYVQTDFGTVSLGRMGTLANDNGTYGLFADLSPLGSGWGSMIGNQNLVFATKADRVDNSVVLESPELYGAKIYAQYSFKDDSNDDGTEGKASSDRYAALGATYNIGGFNAIFVYDYTDESSLTERHGKDQQTFTLGLSYDCGFATTYVAGQYFKDANWVGGSTEYDGFGYNLGRTDKTGYGDIDGYGLVAGVKVPAFGGTAYGTVGYMDADSDRTDKGINRWMIGGGYEYPLSKRTYVYGGAGWMQDKVDNTTPNVAQVVAGMVHSF